MILLLFEELSGLAPELLQEPVRVAGVHASHADQQQAIPSFSPGGP